MKRIVYTIVAAAAVLTGSVAAAAPAMAGTTPGAVYAVTHSPAHNDTTSGTTNPPVGALQASPGGPVWAIDNLTEQFTVTPYGPGEYKVVIDVNGSFAGFADPGPNGSTDPASGYGNALTSNGPVKGTITYYVQSPSGPDKAGLLPNQAPDTGLSAALSQLFPGGVSFDWSPADAGSYTFSYQNGAYVQDGSGIHGDVRGR
jgi:hypothetical protein